MRVPQHDQLPPLPDGLKSFKEWIFIHHDYISLPSSATQVRASIPYICVWYPQSALHSIWFVSGVGLVEFRVDRRLCSSTCPFQTLFLSLGLLGCTLHSAQVELVFQSLVLIRFLAACKLVSVGFSLSSFSSRFPQRSCGVGCLCASLWSPKLFWQLSSPSLQTQLGLPP